GTCGGSRVRVVEGPWGSARYVRGLTPPYPTECLATEDRRIFRVIDGRSQGEGGARRSAAKAARRGRAGPLDAGFSAAAPAAAPGRLGREDARYFRRKALCVCARRIARACRR